MVFFIFHPHTNGQSCLFMEFLHICTPAANFLLPAVSMSQKISLKDILNDGLLGAYLTGDRNLGRLFNTGRLFDRLQCSVIISSHFSPVQEYLLLVICKFLLVSYSDKCVYSISCIFDSWLSA